MDNKLGQENADEWFYESFKRYNNLFMYELEAPIDTMELLDATNLCTTGMQSFSKKCEILQLGVPPKLLPKDIEDGLCKDRDFKIICGGYSSSRVLQTEPIESEKIVAAVQADQDGVGLFQLGDEERGVIREESRLEPPKEAKSEDQKITTGVIASRSTNVIFCEENGTFLSRWSLDSPEKSMYIKLEESKAVSKALYWDDHVVSLNASDGSVRLLDLRGDDAKKATVSVKCVESGLTNASFVQYSFDVKPDFNMIGICDTVGHFQLFDIRKPTEVFSQITIPGYAEAAVLNKKFNLRFQKLTGPAAATADDNTMIKFVISGFKEEIIPVYKCQKSGEILPIFTHDGHTKTVTNAMWHNITDNLLFSASADAVLHAWRYIENVH